MNNLPDLTSYGYQITEELGRNREGGRITWKGINLLSQKTVTIKQFCFASAASSWSGYSAYQQEIGILQQINHSGIPHYLDSLETDNGFCLIQEYKEASNLSDFRQLSLAEIKKVALEILDTLIYLQQQNPPILHRDLKPENILIDKNLQVYLIDFGFASLGSKEASSSSVYKGTPGFMSPEQIIKPTTASDIYSLGVTIICLLTQKNSHNILELSEPDHPYQLNFKPSLPPLNQHFIDWLGKMVEPQVSKRFADAAQAKAALEPLDLEPISNTIAIVQQEPENSLVGVIGGKPANDDEGLWGEEASPPCMPRRPVMSLPQPRTTFALSATATIALSTIFVLAIDLANSKIEKTIINIAIAIIAAVVITITELAAAAIATDKQSAKQAFALAVTIPTLLVAVSGLILGMGEAIAVTAAIALAEGISLTYVYWQQLTAIAGDKKLIVVSWLSAIVIGISLGIKIMP